MQATILEELNSLINPKKVDAAKRFFKTGNGDYGAGDIFIGVTMPNIRIVAKKHFQEISLAEVLEFLKSKIHEHRMLALIILVYKFQKAGDVDKKEIFDLYLKHTEYVNNWDLVDVSARDIVGAYLFDKDRKVLYDLAHSKDLWENRIAIIATMYFIKKQQFEDTFKIAEILLRHKHDLIHKAVGWMIREVGENDIEAEIDFLNKHYKQMPRTMLRYSIEKFKPEMRERYLRGEV